MKKILFFVLTFVAGSAAAQSSYYHRVGDTVRGKSPIYQYEWWPAAFTVGHDDSIMECGVGIRCWGYMKHTTDTPLKVIGIASTLTRAWKVIGHFDNVDEDMDTASFDSLFYVLSDATPNGLVEKARVCWSEDYMTHPKRYLELNCTGLESLYGQDCSSLRNYTRVTPLREYYFDSAITVTDSFYLGCLEPLLLPSASSGDAWNYFNNHVWYYSNIGLSEYDQFKDCEKHMPTFTYYIINYPFDTNGHYFSTDKRFQMIFPIIEVDTACTTPDDPYIAHREGSTVRVEWNDPNNDSWEVSRIMWPNTNPGAGFKTVVTSPYIEYTDINGRSKYSVYVRGHCETGVGGVWSDWSAPCVIDTLPRTGIADVAIANVALTPNPADGTVQIVGLQDEAIAIDVMDAAGRPVMSVEGTSTIDVSSLPSGVYMVRVKIMATGKVAYMKLVKK